MLMLLCIAQADYASSGTVAAPAKTMSADDAIIDVKSYGFIDLEGAKVSAIIAHYAMPIDAASLSKDDYQIIDYTMLQEQSSGFDKTIERDGDDIAGNEGQIVRVYVNNEPKVSASGGTSSGDYVVIEVNTAYMLSGQNLSYTTTMMAGLKQVGLISGPSATVTAGTREIGNYTATQKQNAWTNSLETLISTDKAKIILPEFGEKSGWTLNAIGSGAFKATHCYSEYTGKYEDFELPYSIYVPGAAAMEKNKGKIALVLHMEHAGANDSDPMSAITSSKASVKLSGAEVQGKNPAIIIVPQIEESRRSTNDLDASSEANAAIWELLDSVLAKYKGYIDTDRIYGTGQSMGGMTILYMASQRDNFFAGIAVVGAQWSNSYNKEFQNGGSPARSPLNDPVSFNGFGLDARNYLNWYYMVSDDNILVHTCSGDPMATGEWKALVDYYAAAGVLVPHAEWDPYLDLEQQNAKDRALTTHDSSAPGTGINWASFSRGSHMSTWKYGYQLDYPFQWLFAQNRKAEAARGKIEQLANEWLGRDANGNVVAGSGTAHLNSAQYTPDGESSVYAEGWTPLSATNKLISSLPSADKVTAKDKKSVEAARAAYNLLSEAEKNEVVYYNKITDAEKALSSL
jgi:Predicted peptidase